jgi:hypothetical protein
MAKPIQSDEKILLQSIPKINKEYKNSHHRKTELAWQGKSDLKSERENQDMYVLLPIK